MERYIIDTDEGVVVLSKGKFTAMEDLEEQEEVFNCEVAIFKDKKEAQRIARNIKRRTSSHVSWVEVLSATLID